MVDPVVALTFWPPTREARRALLAAFAAAGVHRLIMLAPSRLDDGGLAAWLRAHAPRS